MILSTIRRLFASLLEGVVRAEHLDDSEIAGFLGRDLSPDERSSVESHIESCQSCRAAILEVSRLTESYETDSADLKQAVPAVTRRRNRRLEIGLVVAAAAGLAIVWLGNVRSNPQIASTRSDSIIAADKRPIVEVVSPPDDVLANQHGLSFVWRSAGTSVYRFALLDETGKTVIEREVLDTVLVLPPETRLEQEHLYFWRVDAIADGIAASSGARKLRFAR
jgi:hypothetical protein